ncbi:hypothetical protein Syun_024005 [Stephania yunnanensis]|uniref:Uncharacterized protein n=1 Tax=Stephania yunnanensis TaxID=152371 RepID=A0AAP0FQY4_9MAGN
MHDTRRLTQATPNQSVDDEAVYLNVAGECPKGRVYGLGSLGRKKRRYADPGASMSQMPDMVPRAEFNVVAEQLRKVMEFMHQHLGMNMDGAGLSQQQPPPPPPPNDQQQPPQIDPVDPPQQGDNGEREKQEWLTRKEQLGVGRQRLRYRKLIHGSFADLHKPQTELDGKACAAVGQNGLMALYDALFTQLDVTSSQLLVTDNDFRDSNFRKQLSETVKSLLVRDSSGIFWDNDSLVAC